MIPFNPRNLLILVSVLMIGIADVHCISDNCALYNSLEWGNTDSNFANIGGFYSVIRTNHASVFGSCEVHGFTQQVNGDIEDRYVKYGSACPSVYKNRITKTPTAFQFAFFNDDTNCMPRPGHRATDNMKMKIVSNLCFFKSFCLPDGTSVVNLLCQQLTPLQLLLNVILSPVVQAVTDLLLSLVGSSSSLSDVPQSCYDEIIGDPNQRALLLS